MLLVYYLFILIPSVLCLLIIPIYFSHIITAMDRKSANKWKNLLAYATICFLGYVSSSSEFPSTESSLEIGYDNFQLKKKNFNSLHRLHLNYVVVNASISSYFLILCRKKTVHIFLARFFMYT